MVPTRTFSIGAALAACVALGSAQTPAGKPTAVSSRAASFQVQPFWPRPLPNHWLFGSITGVAVDSRDHVWVVHRGAASLNARTEMSAATKPPTAESCCVPAPQVLHFDPAGKLVSSWGGPGSGYDWPQSPGGIAVDAKGNVWIAAAGPADPLPGARSGRGRGGAPATPPPPDAHVLKFSPEGKFLLQIGKAGQAGDKTSTTALHRPTALDVDATASEVYVADGMDNHRIVVFDSETGAYKRHWSGSFGTPSCVTLARDGQVYVCDRRNNRLQVFRRDGTLVKEVVIAKETRGEGSVWDVAFSPDPQQRYIYVADGSNQKVWVLNRSTLGVVSTIGAGGRGAGQFFGVGSVAVDSSGNLYTGETYEGKRVQKFAVQDARKPNTKEQR